MGKIIVTAERCKFEYTSGVKFRSHNLMQTPILKETVTVRNVAEVEAAGADVFARAGALVDHSYFVSVYVPRGERAVSGFNKRRWKWERDNDTGFVIEADSVMGQIALAAAATGRPGDQAAVMAEESGIDYGSALRLCNMD